MKMEVLVQQQYQSQYGTLGSNKVKDWTSPLKPPTSSRVNNIGNKSSQSKTAANNINNNNNNNTNNNNMNNTSNGSGIGSIIGKNSNPPYLQNRNTNKMRNSINKNKLNRTVESNSNNKFNNYYEAIYNRDPTNTTTTINNKNKNNNNDIICNNTNSYLLNCDDINVNRVNELSLRLLDELRAAKSRHLTCTEVSLPCDLTPRIAAEILRVSEKEPCGIRGCTIYIEFEDEPNNSRRIATLKLDAETVSTFEIYLTLQQDHRGWTSLLPQFMKSLARTITISPKFTITKNKLYTPYQGSSNFYTGIGDIDGNINNCIAITATPTST